MYRSITALSDVVAKCDIDVIAFGDLRGVDPLGVLGWGEGQGTENGSEEHQSITTLSIRCSCKLCF